VRLLRVFPRRTRATPDDELAFVGDPTLFAAGDRVHVSVAFTEDKPEAERLAASWRHVAPTEVGGVAYGDPGAEFIPGRYIKHGYTFTSRGCPRRCWFCSVWKRDPVPRLLPIQDGWNILDDNLLACPEPHVRAVFAMLARQRRRVAFTGGLEAVALQDYQVGLLADLTPRELATTRLRQIAAIGFTPMAMLWRPEHASQMRYAPGPEWRAFQRRWVRPALMHPRG